MKCKYNASAKMDDRIVDHVICIGFGTMVETVRDQLGFGVKGRLLDFVNEYRLRLSEYTSMAERMGGNEPNIDKMVEIIRDEFKEKYGCEFLKRYVGGTKRKVALAQDFSFMLGLIILHEKFGIAIHGAGKDENGSVAFNKIFSDYNRRVRYDNSLTGGNNGVNDKGTVTVAEIVKRHLESIGIEPMLIFTAPGYDPRLNFKGR